MQILLNHTYSYPILIYCIKHEIPNDFNAIIKYVASTIAWVCGLDCIAEDFMQKMP